MDALLSTLWVSFVLYLLYETDAVYKYLKLFKWVPLLGRLTHMWEYEYFNDKPDAKHGISYRTFMETRYPSFLLDMVTCRYCLGVWLALATVPICGIMWTPVVYLGSQLFYSLFVVAEKKLQDLREDGNG